MEFIAKTVDAKDVNTSQHSERVSEYSVLIAKKLGWSVEEYENLRKIALLHDIGKIGIPDSILNKPGRLTDEEYNIMKSHVVIGSRILKDFTILLELIEDGCVILSQHSDTEGTAIACEETKDKSIFHVGYNQSMTDVAPTTSLIGCRINWKPCELSAVEAVLSGKDIESNVKSFRKGNDCWAGFQEDWVQMLDLNELIAADGTKKAIKDAIVKFKKGTCRVYYGDYKGVDPQKKDDIIDLNKEYAENKESSAPTFHYILKDVITVKTY